MSFFQSGIRLFYAMFLVMVLCLPSHSLLASRLAESPEPVPKELQRLRERQEILNQRMKDRIAEVERTYPVLVERNSKAFEQIKASQNIMENSLENLEEGNIHGAYENQADFFSSMAGVFLDGINFMKKNEKEVTPPIGTFLKKDGNQVRYPREKKMSEGKKPFYESDNLDDADLVTHAVKEKIARRADEQSYMEAMEHQLAAAFPSRPDSASMEKTLGSEPEGAQAAGKEGSELTSDLAEKSKSGRSESGGAPAGAGGDSRNEGDGAKSELEDSGPDALEGAQGAQLAAGEGNIYKTEDTGSLIRSAGEEAQAGTGGGGTSGGSGAGAGEMGEAQALRSEVPAGKGAAGQHRDGASEAMNEELEKILGEDASAGSAGDFKAESGEVEDLGAAGETGGGSGAGFGGSEQTSGGGAGIGDALSAAAEGSSEGPPASSSPENGSLGLDVGGTQPGKSAGGQGTAVSTGGSGEDGAALAEAGLGGGDSERPLGGLDAIVAPAGQAKDGSGSGSGGTGSSAAPDASGEGSGNAESKDSEKVQESGGSFVLNGEGLGQGSVSDAESQGQEAGSQADATSSGVGFSQGASDGAEGSASGDGEGQGYALSSGGLFADGNGNGSGNAGNPAGAGGGGGASAAGSQDAKSISFEKGLSAGKGSGSASSLAEQLESSATAQGESSYEAKGNNSSGGNAAQTSGSQTSGMPVAGQAEGFSSGSNEGEGPEGKSGEADSGSETANAGSGQESSEMKNGDAFLDELAKILGEAESAGQAGDESSKSGAAGTALENLVEGESASNLNFSEGGKTHSGPASEAGKDPEPANKGYGAAHVPSAGPETLSQEALSGLISGPAETGSDGNGSGAGGSGEGNGAENGQALADAQDPSGQTAAERTNQISAGLEGSGGTSKFSSGAAKSLSGGSEMTQAATSGAGGTAGSGSGNGEGAADSEERAAQTVSADMKKTSAGLEGSGGASEVSSGKAESPSGGSEKAQVANSGAGGGAGSGSGSGGAAQSDTTQASTNLQSSNAGHGSAAGETPGGRTDKAESGSAKAGLDYRQIDTKSSLNTSEQRSDVSTEKELKSANLSSAQESFDTEKLLDQNPESEQVEDVLDESDIVTAIREWILQEKFLLLELKKFKPVRSPNRQNPPWEYYVMRQKQMISHLKQIRRRIEFLGKKDEFFIELRHLSEIANRYLDLLNSGEFTDYEAAGKAYDALIVDLEAVKSPDAEKSLVHLAHRSSALEEAPEGYRPVIARYFKSLSEG